MIMKILRSLRLCLGSIYAMLLSLFIKRDENCAAFGSWCGHIYSDNTKYLAEYISDNYPNIKIFWVGNENIREDLPKQFEFVKLNSITSIPKLLKCRYLFCMQDCVTDLCDYNIFRNAIICYTDHGIPIKKWYMSAPDYKGQRDYENFSRFKKLYYAIIGENSIYRYVTVSNDRGPEIYWQSLAFRLDDHSEIIKTGTPRNDYLLHISFEEINQLKKKIAQECGFDAGKQIIGYYPTFRRCAEHVESFLSRNAHEAEKLDELLEKYNAVLLEKSHFAACCNNPNTGVKPNNVLAVEKNVDFQKLLAITDIQIADYSGGFLDYTLLDRPIVQYVYDYEEYRDHDSGLFYNLEEFAAGAVARTFDDVLEELEELLKGNDRYADRRHEVRQTLMKYETGDACRKISETVFAG